MSDAPVVKLTRMQRLGLLVFSVTLGLFGLVLLAGAVMYE